MRTNHWPSMMEGVQRNHLLSNAGRSSLLQIPDLQSWSPLLEFRALSVALAASALERLSSPYLDRCSLFLPPKALHFWVGSGVTEEKSWYTLVHWVGMLSTWSLRTSFTVGKILERSIFWRGVSASGRVLRDPFTFSSPDDLVPSL